MDRIDRIGNFCFLIFDFRFTALNLKSEIKNQKSKILCILSILVHFLLRQL